MAEDVLISDSLSTKSKKAKKSGKLKPLKDVEAMPLASQSDATRKTKARFDQLLRQAVDQGNSDVKVGKKKKKPKTNDDVLEQLKKGEGLVKDEDAAILANTYVPGDSPKNEKSNKKKDKKLEGTENLAYEDETSFSTPTSKRLQKKKDKNDPDRTPSISDQAPPPVLSSRDEDEKKVKKKKKVNSDEGHLEDNHHSLGNEDKKVKKKKKKLSPGVLSAEESESVTSPVISPVHSPRQGLSKQRVLSETEVTGDETPLQDVQRKKKKRQVKDENISPPADDVTHEPSGKVPKKKKKPKPSPSPQQLDEETVESPRSAFSASGEEGETAEIVDETTKIKKRRKKKKQEAPADTTAAEPIPDVEDEGQILAVTIHKTDKLKNDFYILHPLVRVHVIDEKTGNYLRKQHTDRPVTSFYENSQDNLGYIQPIITQPYDFKEKRSTLPMWEELLVFNENFNYFIQNDPKVIIFFELLDFVSMNTASRQYDQAKTQGGWHRIAWAFLKVVGSNDKLNTGSKVRLQLYHPPERYRLDTGQTELYQWWQTAARRPYPSTLYVTLKGITPPSAVQPSMRSLFATQEEVGRMSYKDLKKTLNASGRSGRDNVQKKYLTTWARLAGQACKVPNSLMLSLHAGNKGCFVLKFSHDGRSLACACQDRDGYPILIYEIPSGELLVRLDGHFGIIYDLCWSKTDTSLLSASSDGTARVWDLQDMTKVSDPVLLPHPAFVYTAQFHPRVDTVIATGGYDQVVRVWSCTPDQAHSELLQEIEGHRGNVNSLCFDDDGSKLYTAGSLGNIKIWNVYVSEEPSRRGFIRDWGLYQEIQEPELMGTPINYIKMHPSGRRLLVHSRDNLIRMIDLRILRIMQKYIGALNFREEIHSTLSPCGTFVFAGSEDGSAYVWNTETGDQVACYSELNYHHPVTSLDYHPRDHMIAFCSLGDNQAVFIYNYNPQVAAIGAGIPVKPKESLEKSQSAAKLNELNASALSKEDFEASETARLEKVMKKLASVTLSSQPMIPAESHPLGIQEPSPRTMRTGLLGSSSWGYDQTSTYITPRSMSPPPQMFSPHAPQTLGSTMQQQQMASQDLYFKQAEGGWRPGFSSVGRHGARPSSPPLWGKPPTMSMSTSQGKAQFSFQSPLGKSARLKKVVAMYDYRGQRSDELTFQKGDIIKVLYKDNENWWMGEMRDGQQGFFPANYVAEEEASTDPDITDDTSQDGRQDEDGGEKKKKVTAVRTKTGDLKFVSATEDSEDDHLTPKKRTRRKKKATDSSSDVSLKERTSGSKGSLRARFQEEEESYA